MARDKRETRAAPAFTPGPQHKGAQKRARTSPPMNHALGVTGPLGHQFAIAEGIGVMPAVDRASLPVRSRSARVSTSTGGNRRGKRPKETIMAEETGQVTGTKDKTYNIVWFTEQSLSNALRLGAVHRGRRARRRLRSRGLLPPRPGAQPQGRRGRARSCSRSGSTEDRRTQRALSPGTSSSPTAGRGPTPQIPRAPTQAPHGLDADSLRACWSL